MVEMPVPYHKHDSVVTMRHAQPLAQNLLDRIRIVRNQLAHADLDDTRKTIVQQACDELLHQTSLAHADPPFTLASYVREEMSRLSEEQLPRYLYYRYRYEVYPRRKIIDEFPPCLQIEPTSICNYRCVFCYQTDRAWTDPRNGHMGVMSLELFQRIIDQAEGHCEAVTLASRGEPLLCKEIEAMLSYARGKFLAMKLNTNASRLEERHCHAILQADLNTVVFSIDAASEPAYSQLRVGGHLEQVLRNVQRFQEIRAKQYPKVRTITRVSGVRVNHASSIDEMERVWKDWVDQVAFVAYNPWENVYTNAVNDITTPCSDLWRRMFVWWDGAVNPCDVDYASTLTLGRVQEQSLGRLWRSDRYDQLRRQHLQAQRGSCAPCNRCVVV